MDKFILGTHRLNFNGRDQLTNPDMTLAEVGAQPNSILHIVSKGSKMYDTDLVTEGIREIFAPDVDNLVDFEAFLRKRILPMREFPMALPAYAGLEHLKRTSLDRFFVLTKPY